MVGSGRLTREMGYSPAEFVAVLPLAMRDWKVENREGAWWVIGPGGLGIARLALEARPDRIIGALRVPVSIVEIRFLTDSGGLQDEFVRRFERGFHRGGG